MQDMARVCPEMCRKPPCHACHPELVPAVQIRDWHTKGSYRGLEEFIRHIQEEEFRVPLGPIETAEERHHLPLGSTHPHRRDEEE
jgi:hypothetical protein